MTVQSQFGVTLVSEEVSYGVELAGTFASGTASKTTMRVSGTASFTQAKDYWNERKYVIIPKTGGNANVARLITDWGFTAAQFTFDAFATTIASGVGFTIKRVLLAEIPSPDIGQEMLERNFQRDTLSDEDNVPGKYSPKTSIVTEWRGSGTAAGFNFPDYSPLIKASGFNESTATSNTIIYTPVTGGTSNQKSCSLDQYSKDGLHYKYTGCKSTMALATEMGEIPKVTFGAEAKDVAVDTAAAPTIPDNAWYEVQPTPVLGATFTIAGTAATDNVTSFGLNVNNALTRVGSQASTSGTTTIIITKRPMTMTFNPEADSVTKITDFQAGNKNAVIWENGTTGDKSVIRAPLVQYQTVTEVDTDGIKRFDIEGKCVGSSGNDEVKITLR